MKLRFYNVMTLEIDEIIKLKFVQLKIFNFII